MPEVIYLFKNIRTGGLSRLNALVKTKISLVGALSAVLLSFLACADAESRDSRLSRLLGQKSPDTLGQQSQERLIPPPQEMRYFPVRADGQPFVLDIDTTVNFTDSLNRFYYDPKWRGEVWAPFNQWSIAERATRLMATWPEYDEFSQYRKLNKVNKFFERYSGFGP